MDDIKKKLKAWELTFSIENKRRPNKNDIEVASDTIKSLYREYHDMKKSFEENKVWGFDLNNSKEEVIKATKKNVSSTMARFSHNLSKKLIESDSLMPKKSQSFRLNRSNFDGMQREDIEICSENYLKTSKDTNKSNADEAGRDICFEKSKDEIINSFYELNSIYKSEVSNNSVPGSNFHANTTSSSIQSIFNSYLGQNMSDILTTNHTDKPFVKSKQFSKLKNKYFVNKLNFLNDVIDDENSDQIVNTCEMIIKNSSSQDYQNNDFINTIMVSKNGDDRTIANNFISIDNENFLSSNDVVEKVKSSDLILKNCKLSWNFHTEVDNKITDSPPRYIDRNICSDDVIIKGHEKFDDDVILSFKNKKRKTQSDEAYNSKKLKIDENMFEKNENKENIAKKPYRHRKDQEATVGSIHKGNFVKLNLRVKHYSKHVGQKMSGAKYKRFIWKQRMKNKEDYSSGDYISKKNCFKCGNAGHWAKNCKVKKTASSKFDWTAGHSNKIHADNAVINNNNIHLSEHIEDIDEEVYLLTRQCPNNIVHIVETSVDPIYQLKDDGQIPDSPSELLAGLRLFGYDSFKANQEKAVMRILCGLSTLVILSTGAGKSLIYQLAAYMYAQHYKCISLIISPLISLMQDQVINLPKGIKGAFINNCLSVEQRARILKSARNGELHFLLLSPEMLVGWHIADLPPIAFACIDEVHCLSEWSHHFRPSYLMVAKTLKENYGVRCMLGLTATASCSTINAVCQHLSISKERDGVLAGAPIPQNLLLSVSREDNKDEGLLELLQGERFSNCQSLIVYCTRREQTAHVATLIRVSLKSVPLPDNETTTILEKDKRKKKEKKLLAWDAECYHAGLSAAQRNRIQKKFMSGKLRVVVATVAFGMGIDKQDIRGIIHYNLPKTIESYIQEIGRAGRDGLPAYCHLFLDSQNTDLNELKRHIYSTSMDRNTIKKLVLHVFKPCKCATMLQYYDDNFEAPPLQEADKIESFINIQNEYHPNSFNDVFVVKEPPGLNDGNLNQKDRFCTDDNEGVEEINTKYKESELSGVKCSGHVRAMPIEEFVEMLDLKEEGILTLLCYLELHAKKWIQNLQPAKSWCKVICYGGAPQFLDISRSCPPIKVSLSRQKSSLKDCTKSIEFDVIELADFMGCDSNVIKREIAHLQFSNENGVFSKSGVMVEFTKLSYIYCCHGNKSDDEIDEIVEYLFDRVETQEKMGLNNLLEFYNLLKSVSYKSCVSCMDTIDVDRSAFLRLQLQAYLENNQVIAKPSINEDPVEELYEGDMERIRGDVNSFLRVHGTDGAFTGRAIARIMHGIESPLYPAHVWSKARKYWRSNLQFDFNAIRRIATGQIVLLRK